jgi:hypothetical protein
MGADLHPDQRPAIVQMARNSLGPVFFLGALAAFFELGHILNQPLILPAALVLSASIGILRYSRKWWRRFWAGRRERAQRLANYSLVVEQVLLLKVEKGQLERSVEALDLNQGRRFRAGLREGYARVLGYNLSREITTAPSIVDVLKAGDKVRLTCRRNGDDPIGLGTRFTIATVGAGEPCGAVAVTELLDDGQRFRADVVEETNPEFWAHLRERAGYDFTPPPGVTLVAYPLPQIPDEEQMGDRQQQQQENEEAQ